MSIFKSLIRLIVGVFFGLASGLALSPAIAAFSDASRNDSWVLLVVVAIGALLGLFAPTIRRAFGRSFLLLGVSVFALPLSVLLLSGRVSNEMMTNATADDRAATAIGSGLAGTIATGAAGFVGFFLGTIFLIVGLVLALGGRREVVVVERSVSAARHEPQP